MLTAITGDPLSFARDFWLEIIAGVALLVLTAMIPWLWRVSTRALGRLALRVGTAWPLRGLAVREYLRRVRGRHGQVYNVYLDKEDKLDLAQVFVPLRLLERGDGEPDRDMPLISGTRAVLTAPNNLRLMILGAPGSGKTTLLKALASGVSQQQWPELGALVPVYVRLRAYAQAPDQPELWAWVSARVGEELDVRNAAALLDALAGKGRILLLLDGLDEIGEDAARWVPAKIAGIADRLARDSGSRLIVSCREQQFQPCTPMRDRSRRRRGSVAYRHNEALAACRRCCD
jgi:hypothetical protein